MTNGGAFKKSIINIPKAWAAVNRKNAPVTDSKGYLQTYFWKVEVVGVKALSYLYTAPENWVLKNAVRKWHLARQAQRAETFDGRAGESTYGKTMRPMLHSDHQTTNNAADFYELQPVRQAGAMAGGSWDFTKMAHTVANLNTNATGDVQGEELSDDYFLTLTGSSVLETGHSTGGHNKYSHVSMMDSYLRARRNFGRDGTDDVQNEIDDTPSPLVELMGDSLSSRNQAVILAAEQNLEPPEAQQNSDGTPNFDALDRYYQGVLRTTSTYGRDSAVVRVPGGLLEVWSQGQGGTPLIQWNIEVLGVGKAQG